MEALCQTHPYQALWVHNTGLCSHDRPCGRRCWGEGHRVIKGDLDLGPKGVGVAVQDGLDGRLPEALVLLVVAAGHAVAGVAVAPAGEALAVQLQAAGVFAVAVLLGVRDEVQVPGALAQLLPHLAGGRGTSTAARPALT